MKKTILILSYLLWGIGCFLGGYIFSDFIECELTEKQHVYKIDNTIAGTGDEGFRMVYENKHE